MEDKEFLEQVIKNKNTIEKSIIVLDIVEAIEQFLIASKEIKTIVDFEEKIRNFMGKGFPYKKDIDTLFLLTSSKTNMKFFFDNLNTLVTLNFVIKQSENYRFRFYKFIKINVPSNSEFLKKLD